MKKGFSLIEIILALGIVVIVFVAVFHFAASIHVKNVQTKAALDEKYFSYTYGEPQCLLHKNISQISFSNQNQISLSSILSTSTKITSMHAMEDNTLLITSDSASTSESDIFLFALDIENLSTTLLKAIDVGPGIQDSKLLDHYVYIANTSIHSHIKTLYIDGATITELSNIEIPSLGMSASLPKKLAIYNGQLILGSEKSNSGPEVFIFPIGSDGKLLQQTKTIELDGQLNQALVGYNDLHMANASDPELRVYDNQLNLNFSYDAPLTLGNGKSLLFANPYIVLGRTLGSGELSIIENISSNIKVHDTKRTNGTVDYLLKLNDKEFLAITANEQKELQFWNIEKTIQGAKLNHQKDIDIPGRVTSYSCDDKYLYVSLFINNQPTLLWIEL